MPVSPSTFGQDKHADSKVIGRYAGYLNGSTYEDMDGVKHKVKANANGGSATYNGGKRGWGRTDWEVPFHSQNSILFVNFDYKKEGFPGIFVGCITHTVYPYEWHIGYGVTPLLAEGGPLNLAQQVFFNLDGLSTNGSNTVLNHKLHLPLSGLRFGVDELGIPTGDLLSNREGKEHEFWSGPKEIKESLNANTTPFSYNETFMLSHRHTDTKRDDPAAILSSDRSGITMEVYTDQDALHVRTWGEKDGELIVFYLLPNIYIETRVLIGCYRSLEIEG
jgi:aldose 1-epimerase